MFLQRLYSSAILSCAVTILAVSTSSQKTKKNAPASALDRIGLLNLMVVYLVWSSTYFAIRIAVREGAGFPPFTLGFTRAALAAVVLFAWSRWRGERLKLSRPELLTLVASGPLLWAGGNGLVTFPEKRPASGVAAPMVGGPATWGGI